MTEFLRPDQASAYAPRVDALYYFLCGIAAFFTLVIFGSIFVFVIRFRSTSRRPRGQVIHNSLWLEAAWFAIPLVFTMVMFAWGSTLYFELATPPRDALDMYVVGKQWMWKVQHPSGRRAINQLHVPVGQSVRLILASEDVIHSFYIPAFRVKSDTVPGRLSQLWFNASKPGTYHLFCAEYCGTNHSKMRGEVIVLEPGAYQSWLEGGHRESMVSSGERLFVRFGCQSCHPTRRAPSLVGAFGITVDLTSGAAIVVDEAYLRESILDPTAKIVAGYEPVMPTFKGQISEEELFQIIAYIKSLGTSKDPKAQP